ncbi:MAG: hypothetical protein MJD61_01110 [Proteobacteria bacterium]|nr:hypothetical protein [Pseudomonadota bacterium]
MRLAFRLLIPGFGVLGVHAIASLRGVARRLPLTNPALSVAAFGMIGFPPMAGFVSKRHCR